MPLATIILYAFNERNFIEAAVQSLLDQDHDDLEIVLSDDGFTDEQAMEWLLEVDDSLSAEPIVALRAGRKAEVRRVAQALA